jgi:hypothetical protein
MSGEQDATKKVRFFNVSLINANVMSLPKFPQPQRLVGELVHSIEGAGPEFAWVQFLFKRVNLSPTLVALKNSMHVAAEQIKTPRRSWIDDSESDRPELYRDWYRRSGERIKRIDAVANAPHVLLAIQGMWAGDPRQLSSLPFKDCYDEIDRLGTFVYRNPWMLVELVRRRMVADVSPYFMSYARSRLEPPSFLITQEEIPYYLHLPVAKSRDFLKSITERTAHTEIASGRVEGGEERPSEPGNSRVIRLAKVPEITEPLKEDAVARLGLLPSPSVRGFEVLFEGGATSILLSARSERDLMDYKGTLESVYGALSTSEAPAKPGFLKDIPGLLNLRPSNHSGAR